MYKNKSAMKMIPAFFLIVSCIGYIESALTDQEKATTDASFFEYFDEVYHQAVTNQTRCRELRSQARRYSLESKTAMSEMELDENFVCFCSTSPYYDYLQPTAEWIMSSIFVQYLVIKSIFSLTVCRIYNLYALQNPNIQQAEDCARVASYLNVFRSIAIEDRISEIDEIYKLVALKGNPPSGNAKARLAKKHPDGLSMLNMKAKLYRLDDLLDRLTDIIETEGSQRVPSVSCKGTPINKKKFSNPLAMHLDFYTNANMNVDSAPSYALESIEHRYMDSNPNSALDENYRKYYYEEAWSDIFYNFYTDFFPMANYFNKVLYEEEVIPIRAGAFEPFIPSIDESLRVWDIALELRKLIDTENPELMRSKVITILKMIQMAKYDNMVLPNRFRLAYQSDGGGTEPDFSLDFE